MEMTVAHRLRNLLMSMMGNMTFLCEELKQGRSPDKFLEDMDRSILGASNYTRWLQLLSEKRTVSVTPVDLNDCSRESLDYLNDQFHMALPIRFEPTEELPLVSADPVLVDLMLLELLSESCMALSRLTSERTANGAYSLVVRTSACPAPALSHSQESRQGVELKIEARGFQPWSHSPFQMEGLVINDAFFEVHYSIEVAKSVMRLFHGEVRLSSSQPFNEDVCLSFPPGRR